MKKLILTTLALVLAGMLAADAQTHKRDRRHNSKREAYEKFKGNAQKEYRDFRNQANEAYAKGLAGEWLEKTFQAADDVHSDPLIVPDHPQQPVAPQQPENTPPDNSANELPIAEVIVPPVSLTQPQPLAPIVCAAPDGRPVIDFTFYDTPCKVRFNEEQKFALPDVFNGTLSKAWEKMANSPDYDETLYDCLKLRQDMKLCDWAYLKFLDCMTQQVLGPGNEAALVKGFLLAQSGYKMRMYKVGTDIGILFACNYLLGGKPYLTFDNVRYYSDSKISGSVMTVELGMPQEQDINLSISSLPLITGRPTRLCLHDSPDLSLATTLDLNLLQFFNEYPVSSSESNVMLQWGIYANTPLDPYVKDQIYPVIKQAIDSLSHTDAANMLLHFCQTGFQYRPDNEVWGTERPFFAEETLFYPFSDCEDRAILFSRLVRDLLGLDVALVYYPGHLATAVKFNEEVNGDFITIDGQRFTICDPTYIGSNIGQTMRDMDNQSATALVL